MHVLVIPSELYCPPKLPMLGLFQRHQAEVLAQAGVETGVVSYGFIPWRHALEPFPYPRVEVAAGVRAMRRFVRPLVPARVAYGALKKQYVRRSLRLLSEYVERFGRPDVVHAHNTLYAGVVAAAARRLHGLPYVLTEHSSQFEAGRFTAADVADVRAAFGAAAVISAVSAPLAERMRAVVPDRHGITVIGNVLDPEIERRARDAALSAPGAVRRLLSLGALTPVKDHHLLLAAFARAFHDRADVRLRIGGDGPLRGALTSEAAALGIAAQVDWLGYLDRAGVAAELAAADALVVSSVTETFGVAAIEAMAFGKPVVSTRCGGPEGFIDDEVGILADRDPSSLAAGMSHVLTRRFDAEAIRRRALESYGAEGFARRLVALYATARAQEGQ